jgi:hypothetical protein
LRIGLNDFVGNPPECAVDGLGVQDEDGIGRRRIGGESGGGHFLGDLTGSQLKEWVCTVTGKGRKKSGWAGMEDGKRGSVGN